MNKLLIFIVEEVTLFLGLSSIQFTEKSLNTLHLNSEYRTSSNLFKMFLQLQ